MGIEKGFIDNDERQELDWQAEMKDTDEVPQNHKILLQRVWIHLHSQVEERNFYFSHESLPSSEEIYEAIFQQKPEFRQYKESIQLYGQPMEIDKSLVPSGQSILSYINMRGHDVKIQEIVM